MCLYVSMYFYGNHFEHHFIVHDLWASVWQKWSNDLHQINLFSLFFKSKFQNLGI